MWMNEYDVEDAQLRWREDPVMGPATKTLGNLMDQVNGHSDGWPYWQAPTKAASKLMELIERANEHYRKEYERPRPEKPTAAEVRKSYAPIKSFMTRRGTKAGMVVEFVDPQ